MGTATGEETGMGISEFVGVDGCPSGWFSVGFDSQGAYELKVFPLFGELLDYYAEAKLVLVDIPIGLMEGPGGRTCDSEARKLLKGRSSSVFTAPTRQTVEQAAEPPKDYERAKCTEFRFAGKKISQQTFAIAPKIADVDRVLRRRGLSATPRVREVHPEVCFWALNGCEPMEHRKKTKVGQEERLRVLECLEPRTRGIYGEALTEFRRKCVARDDVLDALVAAVTARCGYDRLTTIPECPPIDCEGLSMEMVYWRAPSL